MIGVGAVVGAGVKVDTRTTTVNVALAESGPSLTEMVCVPGVAVDGTCTSTGCPPHPLPKPALSPLPHDTKVAPPTGIPSKEITAVRPTSIARKPLAETLTVSPGAPVAGEIATDGATCAATGCVAGRAQSSEASIAQTTNNARAYRTRHANRCTTGSFSIFPISVAGQRGLGLMIRLRPRYAEPVRRLPPGYSALQSRSCRLASCSACSTRHKTASGVRVSSGFT